MIHTVHQQRFLHYRRSPRSSNNSSTQGPRFTGSFDKMSIQDPLGSQILYPAEPGSRILDRVDLGSRIFLGFWYFHVCVGRYAPDSCLCLEVLTRSVSVSAGTHRFVSVSGGTHQIRVSLCRVAGWPAGRSSADTTLGLSTRLARCCFNWLGVAATVWGRYLPRGTEPAGSTGAGTQDEVSTEE